MTAKLQIKSKNIKEIHEKQGILYVKIGIYILIF